MSLPQRVVALLVLALALIPAHAAESGGIDDPLVQLRLRDLIDRTCIPATRPATRPIEDAAWSKPDNGLVARIDFVGWGDKRGLSILVRLKNVSDRAVVVPAGNMGEKWHALYSVYTQRGDEPWVRVQPPWVRLWLSSDAGPPPGPSLRPGQTAVAYLWGMDPECLCDASRIKVVLSLQVARPGRWLGTIETPPHPACPTLETSPVLGAIPFPDHFPAFTFGVYEPSGFLDAGGREVEKFRINNIQLAAALALYDAAAVCRELERRGKVLGPDAFTRGTDIMGGAPRGQVDEAMRLYISAIAAAYGSRWGALHVLESASSDSDNGRAALRSLLLGTRQELPVWAVETAIARLVGREFPTYENDLPEVLGQRECRRAVPVLLDLAGRAHDPDAMAALGQIGDPRAISVLLDCAIWAEEERYDFSMDARFQTPVRALGALKAREAVPHLLRLIQYPCVIDALGRIGDPRAMRPLQELVSSKGRMLDDDGNPLRPSMDKDRLFAARLAVAMLEEGDRTSRVGALLFEAGLDSERRRQIIDLLVEDHDPRAIPPLVRFIRQNPLDFATSHAIDRLSGYRDQAAIDGLIACLDTAHPNRRKLWSHRLDLAEALRRITRQPIGAVAADWRAWWNEACDTYRLPDSR